MFGSSLEEGKVEEICKILSSVCFLNRENNGKRGENDRIFH
jgi:hypothetical protein